MKIQSLQRYCKRMFKEILYYRKKLERIEEIWIYRKQKFNIFYIFICVIM